MTDDQRIEAARIAYDRAMRVPGCWQAQQALQMDLARGGFEQISAAHHVRDPLIGVIDHHRQLVGPESVGAFHDKVAIVARQVALDTALPGVFEHRGLIPGGHP